YYGRWDGAWQVPYLRFRDHAGRRLRYRDFGCKSRAMKTSRLGIVLCLLFLTGASRCPADELPKALTSAPCRTAPTIDGVIGEEEWKDAAALEFDLAMAQVNPIAAVKKRRCQVRVMNSANALYIAFQVPDETANTTFSPLDLDFAQLAFCRGKEVS